MSHITKVEGSVKIESKNDLIYALNALKNQFKGLTYVESNDGKFIQVRYDKLDEPVKSYHPDGNIRFSLKNDKTWEMSGDRFRCGTEFDAITKAFNENYNKSGLQTFSNVGGYCLSETTDNEGNKVYVARRY